MLTQQVLGFFTFGKVDQTFQSLGFFQDEGMDVQAWDPLGSAVSVHKGTMTLGGQLPIKVQAAPPRLSQRGWASVN